MSQCCVIKMVTQDTSAVIDAIHETLASPPPRQTHDSPTGENHNDNAPLRMQREGEPLNDYTGGPELLYKTSGPLMPLRRGFNQARLYRKADGAKCSCSTIIGLVTTAQSTPQDALSEGGSEQIVPLIMLPHGEEARLYSVFTAENIGKDRITVKQHPYMLAFALTDFKLQGRTLNKLVISIPRGAVGKGQLQSFYVLVSRVRKL